MNDSTNPSDSSNRFGKNQNSYPITQTNRNSNALAVMRKKIKINIDTDIYQTNTFKKFGQMGKHVQQRNPIIRPVVIRWLNFLFPS
mmetsp:Transcript_11185/g.26125  ORF Transcript_11185/g.26125 Transcript_11185/m.26125 type:complete len:86 (+) Transcript_11185:408-665(+)